ncbi:MAG: esterase-like activity of phytase family protein [Hyphomonadaceae bacterium]|nr:esterase-like activity of phytase family protein [Hyphomonadaceae bacterium]
MRTLVVALMLVLSACARQSSAQDAEIEEQWRALNVTVEPVALGVERTERLRFRGGLAISPADDWFGGVSGIEVLDGERMLMISDRADWFDGRLLLDESGALVGVDDVRIAAMRNERGEVLDIRDDSDSEGLTQLPDGRFAVSFEQRPRVLIYDVNRDGPFGAAMPGPQLAGAASLPLNASFEALATDSVGNLVIGAEGGGGETPIWVAPLGASAPVAAAYSYRPAPGHSLTAMDRGPDGGLYAVERFYAPVIGARARIVFIPEGTFSEAGADAPIEVLATLAPPMALDNFEGISAVRRGDGGVRLYIMSDDNFSDRQRTLLYAFDVESAPD